MRLLATLDSSVVVAGIGWSGGPGRRCLSLLARRAFVSLRTPWLTAEWAESVERVAKESRSWKNVNWAGWLDWLKRASVLLEEPARRPTVRRDPNDDPVLMAAVAGRAGFLVTYDKDLLDLEKPFGVVCIRPEIFVATLVRA